MPTVAVVCVISLVGMSYLFLSCNRSSVSKAYGLDSRWVRMCRINLVQWRLESLRTGLHLHEQEPGQVSLKSVAEY